MWPLTTTCALSPARRVDAQVLDPDDVADLAEDLPTVAAPKPPNILVMAELSSPEPLPGPDRAKRYERISCWGFVGSEKLSDLRGRRRAGHAHADRHAVLGHVRVADGFDAEVRVRRIAPEDDRAVAHDQVLTVGVEAPARDLDLAVQPQAALV